MRRRLALWVFGIVLLVRSLIALGTVFNGRAAAQGPDGIPIDTFGAAGADAVVALFGMWGVGQLALSAIALVTVTRDRSLLPVAFGVLLAEHVLRRAVLVWHPIPHLSQAPTPGFWINMALIAVTCAGTLLSLRREASGV
jgi:hypothetical protein